MYQIHLEEKANLLKHEMQKSSVNDKVIIILENDINNASRYKKS